jgi:hypothetical protein
VDSNWVWAPSDIRRLAESVGGTRTTWNGFRIKLQQAGFGPADFGNIKMARSGKYCSSGAPCEHQTNDACAV